MQLEKLSGFLNKAKTRRGLECCKMYVVQYLLAGNPNLRAGHHQASAGGLCASFSLQDRRLLWLSHV